MKSLIKRHKGLSIVVGLSLILLVVIFAILARMLFSSGSEYGDRLNNIVAVDSKTTDKIISETKKLDEVDDITINIKGKIIYTVITFTDKTSKDKAKEIASKTLESYSEEIIKCYDFEYFLTQKSEAKEGKEDKTFTIAGTKHPDIDSISWTKN